MTVSANNFLPRHRFTVEEYHRMGESGILTEDDRVELIEGEIVEMTPIGSSHASVVNRLTRLLVRAVGDAAIVSVQNPVRLSDHSEPEPDFALLEPRDDDYESAHPGPDDVLLIVEICDSSLPGDRDVKVPLYARHGIPVVWLVDLPNRRVHVYEAPGQGSYRTTRTASDDEQLSLPVNGTSPLTVAEILG